MLEGYLSVDHEVLVFDFVLVVVDDVFYVYCRCVICLDRRGARVVGSNTLMAIYIFPVGRNDNQWKKAVVTVR